MIFGAKKDNACVKMRAWCLILGPNKPAVASSMVCVWIACAFAIVVPSIRRTDVEQYSRALASGSTAEPLRLEFNGLEFNGDIWKQETLRLEFNGDIWALRLEFNGDIWKQENRMGARKRKAQGKMRRCRLVGCKREGLLSCPVPPGTSARNCACAPMMAGTYHCCEPNDAKAPYVHACFR